MAEVISSNQDLFTCPICKDLFKIPVTIPCGHSYCVCCIMNCWDQDNQTEVYSCPECRQDFSPKPALNRNEVIAVLVEQIRKTIIEDYPDDCSGPGDVQCDVCPGRKPKAVKSCLDCLLSYCEIHYKTHNDIHPGRRHKVVDATNQLKDRICTQHEKPLEIFCRTDQKFVCFLCLVDDEHKDHNTVSAAVERKEKQVRTGINGWTHLTDISMASTFVGYMLLFNVINVINVINK